MNLHRNMTLDEFRDEMQHLVMTQKLNSKPIKDALRFARQQKAPAFLRIASSKVEAQKQFLHEEFGPSTMQKIFDFLSGSPKDMAQTVLAVALVLLMVKSLGWLDADSTSDGRAEMEADQMTQQIENFLARHAAPERIQTHWDQLEGEVQEKIDSGIRDAAIHQTVKSQLSASLSSEDVSSLINDAVVQNVSEVDVAQSVARQVSGAVDVPALKKLVHDEVTLAIRETGIGELVQVAMMRHLSGEEFTAAVRRQVDESLAQQKIGELVTNEIRTQIKTAGIRDQILADVSAALKMSDPDGKINALIVDRLAKLDTELEQRAAIMQTKITTSFEQALNSDGLKERVDSEVDRGIKRVQQQTTQSESMLHRETRSLLKLLNSVVPAPNTVPQPEEVEIPKSEPRNSHTGDSKSPVALAAEGQ